MEQQTNVITEQPQHKHDCDCCTFLGRFGAYDLYHHDNQGLSGKPTVIARYGELGDYTSGMVFGHFDRDDMSSGIGEAYRRAKERGLNVIVH
jgi:hypothetical protein